MTGDGGEVRADGSARPAGSDSDTGERLRRELDGRLDELARVTAKAVRPPPAGASAGLVAGPLPGESGNASRPGGFRRAVRPRARGALAADAPAPPPRGGVLARLLRAIGRLLGVRRR